VEPFLTSIRGLASYTIPRVDVQVSGTWRSDPGSDLAANYTVTNAWIRQGPQPLGRNLSEATDVVTGFNETFTATSWLTPTTIQPAGYMKLSAQIDF
jgi:hypothetical protein